MKTKHIFTLIAFLLITNIFAQINLNEYKYVIVPKQFEFLKEADQYQLNSLTKFLFEKEGFITLFEGNDLPEDVANNRCLALFSNVIDDSNMFKTKLLVELKDCNSKVIFKTQVGGSKEKNHKKSYHEALRNAFKSIKGLNYSYKPNEIEQKFVEVETKPAKAIVAPVVTETPKTITKNKEVLESAKQIEKETPKPEVIVKETKVLKIEETPVVKEAPNSNILYAQEISKGFQLVDSTPKIVMILLSTSKQDVYIVKGIDAIVYKENGEWYLSKDSTNTKTLNIKF